MPHAHRPLSITLTAASVADDDTAYFLTITDADEMRAYRLTATDCASLLAQGREAVAHRSELLMRARLAEVTDAPWGGA